MRMRDLDILARTIWGEARGEGIQGMSAVASVIINRYHSEAWYSAPTVAGVAQKAYQFSVWNKNDPNYEKMMKVTKSDPAFMMALEIARQAISGDLKDITGGATHYYASYITPPDWTQGAIETAKIGQHLFYKGVA